MKMRRSLIQYLKDAKKNGLSAFLKKNKLVENGRIYRPDYVAKNIQPGVEGDGLDILWKSVDESEEICQQRTENTASGCTIRQTLQRDKDTWRTERAESDESTSQLRGDEGQDSASQNTSQNMKGSGAAETRKMRRSEHMAEHVSSP
jgi:hypothetical protein